MNELLKWLEENDDREVRIGSDRYNFFFRFTEKLPDGRIKYKEMKISQRELARAVPGFLDYSILVAIREMDRL